MKQLEKHIRRNGYDYEQVVVEPYGYIYAQKMDGKVIAYEVFEHMENEYYQCVSFPSNEAFGNWAWTYPTLDRAYERLHSLNKMGINHG